MKAKVQIHDGIVGAVILGGVLLGMKVDAAWYYLPGIIGALMIQSAFTGFCPVYFVLNKIKPDAAAAK